MPPISVIRNLETRLAVVSNDFQAIRKLVTVLEFAPEVPESAGVYSAVQSEIIAALGAGWQDDMMDPVRMAGLYRAWMSALRTHGLSWAAPIGQVFSGRALTVRGQNAQCGAWLKFFKETGVIPALCNDCYKVQILPHDLKAMFQTYALLLKLDLPNDNARKCMIELREGIKYPYKAYIYADSLEDVHVCLQAFRDLQAVHGVAGINTKVSHGCSEYGQKYPAFKFPESGGAPEFTPKPEWRAIEQSYFKSINLPAQARASNIRAYVSLRDIFAFETWVKYAELIGDPASRSFSTVSGPNLPQPFIQRVRAQAGVRSGEMKELRQKS